MTTTETLSNTEIPFTLSPLEWVPRIAPVDLTAASPAQHAILGTGEGGTRPHPFSLTLAHDPEVFAARSLLSDASMSDEDHEESLSEAEREFAALVESRVNGCRFCAFVHGNASIRAGGDRQPVESVIADGLDGELTPRARAIADFSAKLSASPPALEASDLHALRAAGVTTGETLDLIFAVAQFAWANRTMLTLGDTVARTRGRDS